MDKRGLWQAVLGELELSISKASFGTWFKNTSILSNEDGQVTIAVPNTTTKLWLEKKYHDQIKAILGRMAHVRSVGYSVATLAQAKDAAAPNPFMEAVALPTKPAAAAPATGTIPTPALNPKYTFDSFVVGSSNELAYAACQAVAKNPGGKYNPLFLYGGVGLGKTHLMQAVGNEILKHDPTKRIEYVTSESFTNEFVNSIFKKKTTVFANRFRSVDVLIIDDMQFLGSKEKTQEEFFHTFNTLHQANKQIIISSDKPPKAIPKLEERLRSRFESGMIADIQAPDLETRSAILQSKAEAQGVMLGTEVINYLAANIKQNIRELEGALTQLIATCEFRGIEPSVATATGILGNIADSKPRQKMITPKTVLEKTSNYYDLRLEDLTGPKRDKDIVVPRQIAMYLMRHELGLSFPKIASVVGGRDHTTAMHSVSKIEREVEIDEVLRQEVGAVRERLFI
jgi:chromosomal replication initiator protein